MTDTPGGEWTLFHGPISLRLVLYASNNKENVADVMLQELRSLRSLRHGNFFSSLMALTWHSYVRMLVKPAEAMRSCGRELCASLHPNHVCDSKVSLKSQARVWHLSGSSSTINLLSECNYMRNPEPNQQWNLTGNPKTLVESKLLFIWDLDSGAVWFSKTIGDTRPVCITDLFHFHPKIEASIDYENFLEFGCELGTR